MKCPKHDSKCTMLCVSCDMSPICPECVTDEDGHSDHSFISGKKVAKEEKVRLSQLKTQNDAVKAELKSEGGNLDEQIEVEKKCLFKIENDINAQRQHLHDLADEAADDILGSYRSASKNNTDRQETHRTLLSTNLSTVEKFSSNIERILDTDDDFTAIHDAKDITNVPKVTRPPCPEVLKVAYNRPKINKLKIQNMFVGDATDSEHEAEDADALEDPRGTQVLVEEDKNVLVPVSLKEVSSFQHSDKHISFIRQSYKSCMLKSFGQHEITWTDTTGRVQNCKKFDTKISGFTLTHDSRLLVCCPQKKEIQKVTMGGVHSVANMSPLMPVDIRITKRGDFMVFVVDNFDYDVTMSSVRGIIVYNKDWKEKSRRMKDDNGNNIFVLPLCISVSSNDTVAVVNNTYGFLSHLVILDPALQLKRRIIGPGRVVDGDQALPDLTKCDKYSIQDTTFAGSEHILIAEYYSKSIQLLDEQGQVIRVITKLDVSPTALCLDDDGQLWMGNLKGRVVVYQLQ